MPLELMKIQPMSMQPGLSFPFSISHFRSLLTLLFLSLCLAFPAAAQESTASPVESPAGVETEEISPAATPDLAVRVEAARRFAEGKLLADEGRYAQALAAYEKTLELDGSDPYLHLEVAAFHGFLAQNARGDRKQRQHLELATQHAEQARRLAPDNEDVLKQFAQVHLRLVEQNHFPSLAVATDAFEDLYEGGNRDLTSLLALGQLYLWQRQSERAAEVLEVAANQQPEHRMIQVMLVEALLGSENVAKARGALEQLLRLDPGAFEYRLRLIDIVSQSGDHGAAVEVARGASEEQQEEPRLLLALARELHLDGENEAALPITDRLLLVMEGQAMGLRRLRVAVLSALARYEEAIDELEALLKDESEEEEINRHTVMLSRLLERVGRGGEAAGHLRGLIERRTGREQLQLKLSLLSLLERQGAGDEAATLALAELDSASLEDAPAFARLASNLLARLERYEEAHTVLDSLEERLGETADAETLARIDLQRLTLWIEAEEWQRVVDEIPNFRPSGEDEMRSAVGILHSEALSRLDRLDEALALLEGDSGAVLSKRVELLFGAERDDQARALLEERMKEDEENGLLFAAQVYQRLERYDDAAPLLEQAIEKRGESVELLYLLGAAQERSGGYEAAEKTFQRLLELSPDFGPALNYLGYMWAERGENLEEALDLLHRAVAMEPDNGAYVDSLGWAYFQLGRYREAQAHLEWAVQLIPDDPTILEHLGDLYLRMEKPERARETYRQALELEGETVEQIRQKLQDLDDQGL